MELLAKRAGMSRTTLRAIESGSGSVTMAAYANVLNSLGLQAGLSSIGEDDEVGRRMQDLNLDGAGRRRAPRKPRLDPIGGGELS